jgi:hypothetical protein
MSNLIFNFMKKHILWLMVLSLYFSCTGQNNKATEKEKRATTLEQPNGQWTVNKEFDKDGNLIKYDSIYSWSSNSRYDNLSSIDKDSLLQSFQSRFFKDYSQFKNQGFSDLFTQDSLFSKHFFNDDFFDSSFGKDFMDIDEIRKEMLERQKRFLEKYQLKWIPPKEENE